MEEQNAILPGFRFHPTDEELVGFYLRRKVESKQIGLDFIKHVDIYKHDPWDLPRFAVEFEREWYFFCPRARKYRNSVRPNRVTGSGFWKATGIDKKVLSGEGRRAACIGLKKSLVYYLGSAGRCAKTDWMMHEFRLPPADDDDAEVWTICRIFKRNAPSKMQARQPQHSRHDPDRGRHRRPWSDTDDPEPRDPDPEVLQPNYYATDEGHHGHKDVLELHPAAPTADRWLGWETTGSPTTSSHGNCSTSETKENLSWAELQGIMEFLLEPIPSGDLHPYF